MGLFEPIINVWPFNMKKSLLLFFFCTQLSALSIAQTSSFIDFGDSLQSWLNKRVENAQKGIKEKTEMPFVVRCKGWGCICPTYFIGISPLVAEGPWIYPITPRKFPVSDSLGYSLIVRGYFTGKIKKLDLRSDKKNDPPEWIFDLPQFKISSWEVNKEGYNVDAPKVIQ